MGIFIKEGKIMKIRILFITLSLFSTTLIAMAGEILWQDVDSGFTKAKSIHKYVLADVYTTWCGWCKKLDRETFRDQGLIEYLNEKFVCIKANAQDNSSGQKLADKFGINGYPCALVFDSNGKLIGKVDGYKDAGNYKS